MAENAVVSLWSDFYEGFHKAVKKAHPWHDRNGMHQRRYQTPKAPFTNMEWL